ncbi:hypothetical protein Bca4012_096474 [Brassica carinata]
MLAVIIMVGTVCLVLLFNFYVKHCLEEEADTERIALVSDEVFQPEAVWKLLDIQIICATIEFSTATVTLADADGKEHCACSRGTCPVKSAFKAVDLIVKEPTTLLEYSMDTATEGTDAIATTRVLVRGNALTGEEVQRNFCGTGARMNVVVSAVEAYMEALNKMLDFKEKFLLETSKVCLYKTMAMIGVEMEQLISK